MRAIPPLPVASVRAFTYSGSILTLPTKPTIPLNIEAEALTASILTFGIVDNV